jgi:DNA polymerase-1
LIKDFGSVDNLYTLIDKSDIPGRIKALLIEGKSSAFLSRELVTINRMVPMEFSWEVCRLADYDRDEVIRLFEELEFKSLFDKLPRDKWEENLVEVFS